MNDRLKKITFPHIRSSINTKAIMFDVVIALIPAALGSFYFYGVCAFYLLCIGITSCVLMEYVWQKLFSHPVAAGDFSAVVTGMLLTFSLPVTVPVWALITACAASILIGKQAFGGIGGNLVNPALFGRLFLMYFYPKTVLQFVNPNHTDAVSSVTALSGNSGISLIHLILGNIPGCIGETGKLLLLAGFIYLIVRHRVDYRSSISFLSAALFVVLLAGENVMYHLFSGGLLLAAFFMVTDYASAPTRGKWFFGIIAGLITGFIRIYGKYPEGVCIGILAANCLVPVVDRVFRRRVYGIRKGQVN